MPLRNYISMQVDGPPRKKGMLKGTLMKVVKKDMKKSNLLKEMAEVGLE